MLAGRKLASLTGFAPVDLLHERQACCLSAIARRATADARGRTCTCTIEGLSFAPLHWATRAFGAHGRICTGTLRVLSAPSLRWTTWASWYRVKDSHFQPSRSERDASAVGLTRFELALPEGLSPSSSTFEASRSGDWATGAK